ncbi:MAG TPA: virulence factor [Candidimonas sp.]|nr:virulence factor [Candidimonas sp.]
MKRLIVAGAAVLALLGSATAGARVNVDINIGTPGVIYGTPDVIYGHPGAVYGSHHYYYPPVMHSDRARVIVVPERHFRPLPVYGERHYRGDYRQARHFKQHKGGNNHRHHHHRGR